MGKWVRAIAMLFFRLSPYIKFWTVWSVFTHLVWRWTYWRPPKYNTLLFHNTANTDLWKGSDTICA